MRSRKEVRVSDTTVSVVSPDRVRNGAPMDDAESSIKRRGDMRRVGRLGVKRAMPLVLGLRSRCIRPS